MAKISARGKKQKGNRLEKDVFTKLNLVYGVSSFRSTPGSGAIVGGRNWTKFDGVETKALDTLASDLIVPEWFNFSVECKHHDDIPAFESIASKNNSKIDGFLVETCTDAFKLNKHPLLFFRVSYKGIFFMIPTYFKLDQVLGHYIMYDNMFLIVNFDLYFEPNSSLIASRSVEINFKSDIVQHWVNLFSNNYMG